MNRLSPETNPPIMGHEPVLANALIDTAAWVDMGEADGVLITVLHYRGGDTDLVLSVHEGATAAGTTAITAVFPIWVATDALNDITMTRQTDAAGYTIDTGVYTGSQVVQFYVPSSILSAGYRYVQLGASGGNAASIVSVLYQLVNARYHGDAVL